MEALLLGDANVIIDLVHAQAVHLLSEIVRCEIAEILIPEPVLDEVREEITEDELLRLGVQFVSPTIRQRVEIERMNVLSNSLADKTLFVLCRDLPGSCVWTNDGALRLLCERSGLPVQREFGVLIELVRRGIRSPGEILSVARSVESTNRRLAGIADRVERVLADFTRGETDEC